MDDRHKRMLRSLRSLVEVEVPVLDAKPAAPKRKCPPGFRYDGKHCVPIKEADPNSRATKPGSSISNAIPEGPPKPRRNSDEGDFPHTRKPIKLAQDQEIPLVPDPKSEIMQRPHNAVTYANGQKPYEYADEEWKEYAHNAFTQVKFPDAFANKGEFLKAFLDGDPDVIEDWTGIQNCSAANQELAHYPSLFDKFWEFKGEDWLASSTKDETKAKDEFKDYLDALLEKADKEELETTPPIIIGQHQDATTGRETLWLISGNSRALLYAFMGKPAPVRIVPLNGRMLPDPTDQELKSVLWPAEQTDGDDQTIEQNVRAAVQQVIQARGAPSPEGVAAPQADAGVQAAAQQPPVDAQQAAAQAAQQPAPGPESSPPAAAPAGAMPSGVPAQAPQESVMHSLRAVFEGVSKRTYPSGHTKRIYRKLYKTLGYPLGTVRNWKRGKVVKTGQGWEDLPEGFHSSKTVSTAVPSAAHDEPSVRKSGPKSYSVAATPSNSSDGGHWIESVPGFPKETIQKHYSGWKQPKRHRAQLHELILSRYFDKVKAPTPKQLETKRPVAIMLMGGPASGKSTIGAAYPEDKFVHLDADALKFHIPEYKAAIKWRARNAAKMVHEESIHLMQQLRERTIAAKKNLVMDGTGRHLDSYLSMIRKLKAAGYHVKVVMADVDQKTAERRSQARGESSGRWVPPEVFGAAYQTVPRNFETIARMADDFELWDTRPEGTPALRWEKSNGKEVIHDPDFVISFRRSNPPLAGGRDRANLPFGESLQPDVTEWELSSLQKFFQAD